MQLKIADFGLSRVMPSNQNGTQATTLQPSTPYLSPEMLYAFSSTYTVKVDVWSAGCILAQFLNQGKPLFYELKLGGYASCLRRFVEVMGIFYFKKFCSFTLQPSRVGVLRRQFH